MRQSTETEGCIRLRAFFLYDLVSGSPFFGVWVLLVEFGTLESSGDDFVRGANAWLDLGYVVCGLGEVFFSVLTQLRRCSVDASPEFLLRCSHLETCALFLRRVVADWWFDGDGHFCCTLQHFRAPLRS